MRQKALGWINNISHGIHMFWVMEAPDMYRFVLHQVLCVSLCLLFVNLCFGFNRCCGLLCFKKKYFVAKNQVKCKSNYENKNQQDQRCLYGDGPRSDVTVHSSFPPWLGLKIQGKKTAFGKLPVKRLQTD